MSLILLAGGKSTRLKKDKAFLRLNNKTIIEGIINKLKPIFKEIMIITNNVEDYGFLGLKVIPDIVKDKGPLGGIYTGLKTSKDKNNFILAVDMPFINEELIKYMLTFDSYDMVIPGYNGYIEPLHSIYSKNVLPIIEKRLESNDLKLKNLAKKLKNIKYIGKQEIESFDAENICFFNINNKEDLEKARELVKNEKRI